MKRPSIKPFPMNPDTIYVWVGGSCDYGHEERASAGAYIMQKDNKTIDTFITSDFHTTEFRMILSVMIHAMEILPESSKIVFLTNVAYIQNFAREPGEETANSDLIRECIQLKAKHKEVSVKILPYHKYPKLPETHEMAHEAMQELRKKQ